VYGCSVVAALTAQNTREVTGIHDVPAAFVGEQIDAVFSDIRVDAVKIGMLSRPEIIVAVAEGLRRWKPSHVVLDPVMVAKSGDKLLRAEAVATLKQQLLPLATLITPNLPEAAVLLDGPVATERRQMAGMAARLQGLGVRNVLLKGGHLGGGASPDLLLAEGEIYWFEADRVPTGNTHGTGCTLSSAIAALLARGMPLPTAVGEAKRWLDGALRAAGGLGIGHGHGPVHHFHALWPLLGDPR
jgi:hydroxymethylpyrimidine/phosphomethylpyrimidine kinase